MPELITSRKNEWVRYAAALASNAQTRWKEGRFFTEGARLCRDAAQSGISIFMLFYTEQARRKYHDYLGEIIEKAKYCYEIEPHVAELLAGTKTTQGVFCVCAMRSADHDLSKINTAKQYVAIENIQDPGNLGTVLRTAEALGIGGVILAGNGCDLYSPKVLRASMGAVFRIHTVVTDSMVKSIHILREIGMHTYAAVPDANACKITEISFDKPGVMIVGNEGNGLTQEAVDACDMRVTIPMLGRAESLNAASAAAILMWEQIRGHKNGI